MYGIRGGEGRQFCNPPAKLNRGNTKSIRERHITSFTGCHYGMIQGQGGGGHVSKMAGHGHTSHQSQIQRELEGDELCDFSPCYFHFPRGKHLT